MTQVDLAAVAIVVRRLCTGLAVEVAAVVPLVGNRWGAPMLLAVGRSRDVVLSPARVLRAALVVNATAVVLAHNHLDHSGPSPADHALTRRLVAAGAVLGVPLSGHLVVGPGGWFDCFELPSTRRSYELAGAQDCASASTRAAVTQPPLSWAEVVGVANMRHSRSGRDQQGRPRRYTRPRT